MTSAQVGLGVIRDLQSPRHPIVDHRTVRQSHGVCSNMTGTLITRLALSTALGAALVGGSFSMAHAANSISEQDAHAIGVAAYTYFYSL